MKHAEFKDNLELDELHLQQKRIRMRLGCKVDLENIDKELVTSVLPNGIPRKEDSPPDKDSLNEIDPDSHPV